MNEDKIVDSSEVAGFLMSKVSDLYVITDLLYEKLKENNIDMSDFQERYDARKESEAKALLNEFKNR